MWVEQTVTWEPVFKLAFILILQEQSHKMHAIEEHKVQQDQSDSGAATGRESGVGMLA